MATGRPSIRTALPYLTAKPREEIALERGLLVGVAVFRWVTWIWMAAVLLIDLSQSPGLSQPAAAVTLVVLALGWTAAASVLARVRPSMLLDGWALAVEFTIAAGLVYADWYAYGYNGAVPNVHSQSLGSAWPLAVIISIGIAYAGRAGIAAGVVMGATRVAGQFSFSDGIPHGDDQLSAFGSILFYAVAGGVAGFVTKRLRESEREIATARARDEVGRTLHDGVLQTLAIVQRRSDDDDLVTLARQQEIELREFLFGTRPDPKRLFRPATTDLAAALRATAADAERHSTLRVAVVSTDDLAPMADDLANALTGAVGEALTNAAKHSGADQVTVFVEPDDAGGTFCSVKDNGCGFDAAHTPEGIGLTRSIRGRVLEVGGRVEIDGRPGSGTSVKIWVPQRAR